MVSNFRDSWAPAGRRRDWETGVCERWVCWCHNGHFYQGTCKEDAEARREANYSVD